MKTIEFGWECDDINNGSCTLLYPVLSPIIVRGYHFSLAMMVTTGAWIPLPLSKFQGQYSEVLFWAAFQPTTPAIEFGKGTIVTQANAKFKGGGTSLHGNDVLSNGFLTSAILKTYVDHSLVNNSVNETIRMSDLNIPVAANTTFQMFAGHMGFGPTDFEVQGMLYYDSA